MNMWDMRKDEHLKGLHVPFWAYLWTGHCHGKTGMITKEDGCYHSPYINQASLNFQSYEVSLWRDTEQLLQPVYNKIAVFSYVKQEKTTQIEAIMKSYIDYTENSASSNQMRQYKKDMERLELLKEDKQKAEKMLAELEQIVQSTRDETKTILLESKLALEARLTAYSRGAFRYVKEDLNIKLKSLSLQEVESENL